MRQVPPVALLVLLLLAGCSDSKPSAAIEVDLAFPVELVGQHVIIEISCPGVMEVRTAEIVDGHALIWLAVPRDGSCELALSWTTLEGAECRDFARVPVPMDVATAVRLVPSCRGPDPEPRELGTVAITHVVTASAPSCRPRIQLIYVIPSRMEIGESTHVEVQTQNLVGETRVVFAVDNEAHHHAEIELAEPSSCALGSTACRELTCSGLDELAKREDDGRPVGEAQVAVTVQDDECRDTERVTVECVAPAEDGPRCGNGVLDPGEECDHDAGLEDPAVQDCADDCLTLARCGNRIVERAEACDDGNQSESDGCSSRCTLGKLPVCGDSVLDSGEQCDDGNLVGRDGCGSDCSPSPVPHCGDRLLDDGEACDGSAGLAAPEVQVCAEDCTIAPICGNGLLEVGEACDDGNRLPGDGCELDCSQTPVPVCGNGVREGAETCDDGNDGNGDGCDSRCDQEPRGFCARYPQAWICELIDILRNQP